MKANKLILVGELIGNLGKMLLLIGFLAIWLPIAYVLLSLAFH